MDQRYALETCNHVKSMVVYDGEYFEHIESDTNDNTSTVNFPENYPYELHSQYFHLIVLATSIFWFPRTMKILLTLAKLKIYVNVLDNIRVGMGLFVHQILLINLFMLQHTSLVLLILIQVNVWVWSVIGEFIATTWMTIVYPILLFEENKLYLM